MAVPAPWAATRCNWPRMPVPPSLRRRAPRMRRTSSPSEPARLSIIERRSSRKSCERKSMVFDLIGGETQKRSFLVLKEGGHLVSAVQPVSQEEAAMHHVSGVMMRLAPSGDVLSRIGRLLEEGTIRPDVATVYALQDAAQAWKDIAEKLPRVHGMSPEPGAPRRKNHGKIVLRV